MTNNETKTENLFDDLKSELEKCSDVQRTQAACLIAGFSAADSYKRGKLDTHQLFDVLMEVALLTMLRSMEHVVNAQIARPKNREEMLEFRETLRGRIVEKVDKLQTLFEMIEPSDKAEKKPSPWNELD